MKNKELLLEEINNTIVELLHGENLYLEKDRKKYMQEEPHKRVYKIIDKYKVQNVELTSQKNEVINHIPLRRFHFIGQQDGNKYCL